MHLLVKGNGHNGVFSRPCRLGVFLGLAGSNLWDFSGDMESDSWFRCVGEPASFHHGTDGQDSTRIFIKKIDKQKIINK